MFINFDRWAKNYFPVSLDILHTYTCMHTYKNLFFLTFKGSDKQLTSPREQQQKKTQKTYCKLI